VKAPIGWRRAVLFVLLAAVMGCKGRMARHRGDLTPPRDAVPWGENFSVAFDDAFTPTEIELRGRAPNDVLDQRLFQARLGHANVVFLAQVEQVWGKGRYQGRRDQYLEVTLGDVLLGELDRQVKKVQLLRVRSEGPLPGSLQGQQMIVFLRWAPETSPPYHHHLVPAREGMVSLIKAMVGHAEEEGAITGAGKTKGKAGRRNKRKARKAAKKSKAK
jgi:hypothetical protein